MLKIINNTFELTVKEFYFKGIFNDNYYSEFPSYIYSIIYKNKSYTKEIHINNGAILDILGYDTKNKREQLFNKVLGYYKNVPLDWFPFCKSKEDVIKILFYLNKIYPSNSHFLYLQNLV